MTKNMNTTDRIVRLVIAVAIAILYFTNVISGALAIILGILAVVFLATSLLGFCPLYAAFKLSTIKK
ncbi:MAG: DUF2892 domain-containing protein [Chloroflexota bacterium]|jgi:hypothetical protein